MNKFLDLAAKLDFSKMELRELIDGKTAIVDELKKLGGEDGRPAEADEARFDGLIARAEDLAKVIETRQSDQRVETRAASYQQIVSGGGNSGRQTTGINPPATPPQEDRDILNSLDRGKNKYSLLRAISLIARNKPLDGIEGEVNQEMERRAGRAAQGFYLPWQLPIYTPRSGRPAGAEFRSPFDTTAGDGLIPTMRANWLVDVLRNRLVMAGLGAEVFTDMVGVFDIPKITGEGTAYWVGEDTDLTASAQAVSQITYEPTTVGAFTDITRRLLKQSSPDAERITRNALFNVLRLELDRVGLNGEGANDQPEGILQNGDVPTVEIGENGGPATWPAIVELETLVADSNADVGNLAYVTTPRVRGHLKTVETIDGSGAFIWDDGMLNGYQALATKQLPDDLTKGTGEDLSAMLFGNFADCGYAFWGGIDVNVDTASLSKSGGLRIVLLADTQFKLFHAESFAKCVDINTYPIVDGGGGE